MKTPVIVFLDATTLGDVDNISLISDLGSYTEFDFTSDDLRVERSMNADILITNKVLIDDKLMDACNQLKLVCIAATGMNNVDLEYAAKKGIEVQNVAGYSTESVAQSTYSMLFYLLHQNRYYDMYVQSGEYAKSPIFTHQGPCFWELKNKIFGIIGMGAIGKRVAGLATAFGSRVIYYSTSGSNLSCGYEHVDLEHLLQVSDIISIHCPLNERTKDLIGGKELDMMKSGVILLNMGRGGIVNEKALSIAIDQEQIAGAAIDVLTAEPIKSDNPLMQVKNKNRLFITPHIAWASLESRRLLVEKLAQNIRDFLA
jgi:lactate dehydrogenase-like 2-hydroxyacid dehydrogenase